MAVDQCLHSEKSALAFPLESQLGPIFLLPVPLSGRSRLPRIHDIHGVGFIHVQHHEFLAVCLGLGQVYRLSARVSSQPSSECREIGNTQGRHVESEAKKGDRNVRVGAFGIPANRCRFSAVPEKNKPYRVGDRIQISLNNQILDGVIRAVNEQTDGLRLQVDFGHEQTALIYEWQVVKK